MVEQLSEDLRPGALRHQLFDVGPGFGHDLGVALKRLHGVGLIGEGLAEKGEVQPPRGVDDRGQTTGVGCVAGLGLDVVEERGVALDRHVV